MNKQPSISLSEPFPLLILGSMPPAVVRRHTPGLGSGKSGLRALCLSPSTTKAGRIQVGSASFLDLEKTSRSLTLVLKATSAVCWSK